jgi:hypothetical protein
MTSKGQQGAQAVLSKLKKFEGNLFIELTSLTLELDFWNGNPSSQLVSF